MGAIWKMAKMEWPPIMALTDIAIKSAKHGAKPKKLFDERGLFVLLQPNGGKLWRLKYRIALANCAVLNGKSSIWARRSGRFQPRK